jgi:hypothetical protein
MWVTILAHRSIALWLLGYPQAALADVDHALKDARDFGQAATLMLALWHASFTHILCRDYTTADAQSDEIVAVADEKGALQWKAEGTLNRGWVLALTGKRRSEDHLRNRSTSVNGNNRMATFVFIVFGHWFCRASPI